MNSSVVDYDFAKAWDQHQGSFAHGIAQKLLSYGERTNKNFKNVYDIVCGASNLLSFFNEKGLKCFGTETRQGMYEYSKEKIPTATYYHTKKMYELPGKEKISVNGNSCLKMPQSVWINMGYLCSISIQSINFQTGTKQNTPLPHILTA